MNEEIMKFVADNGGDKLAELLSAILPTDELYHLRKRMTQIYNEEIQAAMKVLQAK